MGGLPISSWFVCLQGFCVGISARSLWLLLRGGYCGGSKCLRRRPSPSRFRFGFQREHGRRATRSLGCLDGKRGTYVPDVDFVVVLLFLDDFWRGVERSSAAGVSQQRGVDRPAEIANFDYALDMARLTQCRRIFSGFMSRWMISLSCMNSTAWLTCLTIPLTFSSEKRPSFLREEQTLPPQHGSRMRQRCSSSQKKEQSWTMLGWSRKDWILTSLQSWLMKRAQPQKIRFGIFLSAQINLTCLCLR